MKTTDGDLLKKFAAENNQSAFEDLFQRHRSMVMGVCHRVLGYSQDAEDAFQVTFLVLIQKADSISHWDHVAGWLYQVALRTSYKLQAKKARQHQREVQIEEAQMEKESTTELDQIWQEVRPALDAELDRLPSKYRFPVILCYLEGRTYEEVAQELGIPHSTVRKRLEYARELLKGRFIRRGITLSVGVLGTLLSQKTQASVSAQLAASTLTAATSLISHSITGVTAGTISAQVAALTKGTIKAMTIKKSVAVAAMALILLGIGTGTGVTLRQTFQGEFVQKGKNVDVISMGKTSKITSLPKQQPKNIESTLSENSLTAKDVIDQIISEIENTDPQNTVDVEKIKRQLQRLKDFGEDGSKAIQAFLRTSEDVGIPDHSRVIRMNGVDPVYALQSLRAVFLETLYGMSDPTAKAVNLEVLKNTPIGFEVFLTTRNLEKNSPGVYREEALKAVCEVLAHAPTDDDPRDSSGTIQSRANAMIMRIVGYYQAQEISSEIENRLFGEGSRGSWKANYYLVDEYLGAITEFPVEDQTQVFKRLIHDEKILNCILDKNIITTLDFQNDEARQLAQEIFVTLPSSKKEEWLHSIVRSTYSHTSYSYSYHYLGSEVMPFEPKNTNDTTFSKGRKSGALQLLDELAPQMDTPVLKERLENTRKEILQISPL